MGDLTDIEFSTQQAVAEWTAGIPGWSVLLAVVLIASYVAWRRARPDPVHSAVDAGREDRAEVDAARR